MVRFYKNKYPIKGENVVVCIIDNSTINIKCSLLEYNCIEAMICRAEVSRMTSKAFKKLKPGDIIPVVCAEVSIKHEDDKELVYIDLNYVAMDKDLAKHYKDRYDKIQRIVNFFAELVGSDNKYSHLIRDEYLLNEDISKTIKLMVKESLHKMSKDEIESLFYENTIQLHEVAKQWTYCNSVPNFMDRLIKKFPQPSILLVIQFSLNTTKSFGIRTIKNTCNNILSQFKTYDDISDVQINLLAIPNYRLVIKSPNMSEQNMTTYFSYLQEIFTNLCTSNNDLNINIFTHSFETSNGNKLNTKTIDVLTEVLDDNEIDSK